MLEINGRRRAGGTGRLGVSLMAAALAAILAIVGCGKGAEKGTASQAPAPGQLALDADSQDVAKKIQDNMKDFLITNKVPSGAKVTLEWVKKSPYEGMYEAGFAIELGGQHGRRSYFFDRRAEHFVMGPVYTVGEIFRRTVDMRNMTLVDRPSKGPESAPVVIAEYSDFQCSYCSAAAGTVAGLVKKYGNQVRLVFKHMPLTQLHPWAYDAALTAECAAAQKPETFWYFYDITRRITKENFKEKTDGFAKTLNLDVKKLDECVEKKEPKAKIDYDLGEASSYGFTATPTFVINGVVVVGSQPLSVFEEVIQEQLQKAGKAKG